jgi:hypothetical protein
MIVDEALAGIFLTGSHASRSLVIDLLSVKDTVNHRTPARER